MPKGDEDQQVIALPLERLARLMRASEHEHGLNPAQWEALRYLARANRFSNSPAVLARYLGATKGTISQTVMILERKGLVVKSTRAGEKRSVELALSPKGAEALARDPWARLSVTAHELSSKTRRRLAKGLRELLAEELKRGQHQSFGVCSSCRYFREKGREDNPRGPNLCMLFDQPLSVTESHCICVEHQAT